MPLAKDHNATTIQAFVADPTKSEAPASLTHTSTKAYTVTDADEGLAFKFDFELRMHFNADTTKYVTLEPNVWHTIMLGERAGNSIETVSLVNQSGSTATINKQGM